MDGELESLKCVSGLAATAEQSLVNFMPTCDSEHCERNIFVSSCHGALLIGFNGKINVLLVYFYYCFGYYFKSKLYYVLLALSLNKSLSSTRLCGDSVKCRIV